MTEAEKIASMSGPLLVLSGPGTGKTYTLALRIKYLMDKLRVPKEEITVITFTQEAAYNMRARLSDKDKKEEVYVEPDRQPKLICTMHSLGNRIIGWNTKHLKLKKDYQVLTDPNVRQILLEDAAQLAEQPRERWRETAECRTRGVCVPEGEEKCAICDKYKAILRSCNMIDYDDQVILAVDLLKQRPELLESWQKFARHLLVDEYQDINNGQFQLIKMLSSEQEDGLFVVGDDDQSIYSWRYGSSVYLHDFQKHFGADAKVKTLTKCWRCPPRIYQGAIKMVENLAGEFNQKRQVKTVNSFENNEDTPIFIHNLPSEEREAKFIAELTSSKIPTYSILILVPNRFFLRPIENALKRRGVSFDSQVNIQSSNLRLLSVIGKWLKEERGDIFVRECIQVLVDKSKGVNLPSIRARNKEKIAEREAGLLQVSQLWQGVIDDGKSLYEVLKERATKGTVLLRILNVLQVIQKAASLHPGDFMQVVAKELKLWKNESERLFEEINYWKENLEYYGSGKKRDPVRILTIQKAKGLSAHYVFVIGLEEGVFPQSDLSSGELAERSRLLYVSMTRAEKELHLLHTRKRSGRATLMVHPGRGLTRSSFLEFIPEKFIESPYHPPTTR